MSAACSSLKYAYSSAGISIRVGRRNPLRNTNECPWHSVTCFIILNFTSTTYRALGLTSGCTFLYDGLSFYDLAWRIRIPAHCSAVPISSISVSFFASSKNGRTCSHSPRFGRSFSYAVLGFFYRPSSRSKFFGTGASRLVSYSLPSMTNIRKVVFIQLGLESGSSCSRNE